MLRDYPLFLGNQPMVPNLDLEVFEKYSGRQVARVSLASEALLEQALALASEAKEKMRRLASFERRDILYACVSGITARRDEFIRTLCAEVGKPIKDARLEVDRCIETFRIAAEESTRLRGELLSLDVSEATRGTSGSYRRFPLGVCAFITPFNFPLNLVAHKVAPAIAAGCPFILKPATLTPLSALLLGEVLAATAIPKGGFSILPCNKSIAGPLSVDPRVSILSFTGSPAVGWDLKARATKKKVVLELGGNAACLVDEDSEIQEVVSRVVAGAFGNSGQSCISVQRVLVHQNIYSKFREALVKAVEGLVWGDPSLESTVVGPMISEAEAKRLESWIESACKAGAKRLVGGERKGALLPPCLLEGVPTKEPVYAEEAFGPVLVLAPVSSFEDGIREINNSKFGLQAGVFTRDIHKAQLAWETLEVGGVIVGDVPTWRSDAMPYGGVKESGQGREGVRFAIEEMTELRTFVLRPPPRTLLPMNQS